MNDHEPTMTLWDAFVAGQMGRNNHAIQVSFEGDGSQYQPPMSEEAQSWYDMGIHGGLLMGVALALHHPDFTRRLADSLGDDWKLIWQDLSKDLVGGLDD